MKKNKKVKYMNLLTERQKNINTFNRKTGKLSKEGEKKLYTFEIEKAEAENKNKILDEKKLEIIGRKFLEEFKDIKIHQNTYGNSKDYVNLGRVIANKEKIMLNNNLAQLIARKYILKSAPKLMPPLRQEELQTKAIISQNDHSTHYLEKDRGFDEFGDKKFYIELPIGALFKVKKVGVNSPDGIFIDYKNNKVKFYFVELKSGSLFSKGNSLTLHGKYLKEFLGKNNISKLSRIGVINDNKQSVNKFKENYFVSKNSLLFTTEEFSNFIQGAIIIRDVYKNNYESLENNPTLKKLFENLHEQKTLKLLKSNINDFIKYVDSLNSKWTVNKINEETNYFTY
jgi:predicted DNA-binding WGR domain protein